MANYVHHRIICNKDSLNNYLMNQGNPYHEDLHKDDRFVSFHKIFGLKDMNEFVQNIDDYEPSPWWEYELTELSDNKYELLFSTKWGYPINTIKKLLELDNELIWYAVEDNEVYVSQFSWSNNHVIEMVCLIDENDFDEWWSEIKESGEDEDYDEPDDPMWHYPNLFAGKWIEWKSDDDFKRYQDFKSIIDIDKQQIKDLYK